MKESKILDVLERMELFFYRSAKKVVAVTPAFKRNLVQRGIDPHKVEVIPNGSNLELFRPGEDRAGLKQSLGLDGLFVVSYWKRTSVSAYGNIFSGKWQPISLSIANSSAPFRPSSLSSKIGSKLKMPIARMVMG